jgi:PII-like signaling protein
MSPGKLLRVFVAGDCKSAGRPIYEAIVEKCREMHIAGATVLRGDEGFGSGPEIQGRPIEVIVVDEAAKVEALIPALEAILPTGAIAVTPVQMKRLGGQANFPSASSEHCR